MSGDAYIGGELELFAEARRWKAYLASRIRPFLGSNVLEVGSGIGGTTRTLCDGAQDSWVCLEPDARLAQQTEDAIERGELPACCRSQVGTIEHVAGMEFDTVLYVDVLEHIEDDASEARAAAKLVSPGGHLVVLCPAHGWLFSPFDEAIGHFRRYTRGDYERISPEGLESRHVEYIDSVGLLASLSNRLLLRKGQPTPSQIATWDRLMVPLSRCFDPLLGRRVGKSILGAWRRPA